MKNNDNQLKDIVNEIEYKGNKYLIVFNLNVMQEIQEEYKTIEAWGGMTDGTSGEINIKALIFGFTKMINEGIEIRNEENNTDIKPMTEKQVGRMITDIGLEAIAQKLNEAVIGSTKTDEPQKNV